MTQKEKRKNSITAAVEMPSVSSYVHAHATKNKTEMNSDKNYRTIQAKPLIASLEVTTEKMVTLLVCYLPLAPHSTRVYRNVEARNVGIQALALDVLQDLRNGFGRKRTPHGCTLYNTSITMSRAIYYPRALRSQRFTAAVVVYSCRFLGSRTVEMSSFEK